MPTLAEIWDFLVGFKEATEAGFARMQSQFTGVQSQFTGVQSRLTGLQSQLNRMEARLVRIESWNVDQRLDDHEQRILRLEQNSASQSS